MLNECDSSCSMYNVHIYFKLKIKKAHKCALGNEGKCALGNEGKVLRIRIWANAYPDTQTFPCNFFKISQPDRDLEFGQEG